MSSKTIIQILRLALRIAEFFLGRKPPKRERPASRADKVVAAVAPLANKALDRVAPKSARPGSAPQPPARAGRRSAAFAMAQAAFWGTLISGATAYVVIRQQRLVRARYWPVQAPFPKELLEVLAAPGGGQRLRLSEDGSALVDPKSGARYPVIDGIPDFMSDGDRRRLPAPDDNLWLRELFEGLRPRMLGLDHSSNAALAGSIAASAAEGWALSAPCGSGRHEIEMARANPRARILCVDHRWNALLEARRRALEAGLANVYFARGDLRLLPLQDLSISAVWTAGGLHLFPKPEMAMAQIARAARVNAPVAGVSLVAGGPRLTEALTSLTAGRLPGRRDVTTYFSLLAGAGLRDLRAYRSGGYVSFTSVRA